MAHRLDDFHRYGRAMARRLALSRRTNLVPRRTEANAHRALTSAYVDAGFRRDLCSRGLEFRLGRDRDHALPAGLEAAVVRSDADLGCTYDRLRTSRCGSLIAHATSGSRTDPEQT